MNWLGNQISRFTEFSLLKQQFGVCVGSQSFGVGFLLGLFCWIYDSLRKGLKNFESLSQLSKLVEKTRLAGSLNSVCWNGSLGSLLRLCWFLVIRSLNCTTFIFLNP